MDPGSVVDTCILNSSSRLFQVLVQKLDHVGCNLLYPILCDYMYYVTASVKDLEISMNLFFY